MCTPEYRHSLNAAELLVELNQLFGQQRQSERLICRYLADLADRMQEPTAMLSGYADVYHLARCQFGLSFRATRERVRVGKALRDLPATEQALLSGELSYSRVREVTRVARPQDEVSWLREARRLPIRALEQRVVEASARPAHAAPDGPGASGAQSDRAPPRAGRDGWDRIQTHFLSPQRIELRISISADAWALLERAMQGARRASEQSLSDAEALAAVARDALAQQAEGSADLRRTVVLYECEHCGRTELDTGAQPMDLSVETAARLGCGAQVLDLKQEGQLVHRGGPLPAAVRRAVLLRDRYRCRVPGCQLSRYVDVHHLQQQCQGGVHSRKNCLCLCERHHHMLHEGRLWIEGNAEARADAPDRLQFFHADGEPLVDLWTRLTGAWGAGAEAGADGKAHTPVAIPTRDGPNGETHSGSQAKLRTPVAIPTRDGPDGETHSGSQAKPRTPVAIPTRDGPDGETHSGSQVEGESACDARSKLSPQAAKLLAIMGHRGGWCTESLLRASGLSVAEVADAMLRLELAGRVHRDWTGVYAPLG